MRLFASKMTIFLIAFLLLCAVTKTGTAGLTISKNGISEYTIVMSVDASLSEVHGARELQMFLEEIGGAYIPVKRENEEVDGPMILVGESGRLRSVDNSIDFARMGDEGFVIRTREPHLIIAGGRLRGTMYGVYAFLEDILGCRWYTDQVSKIPRINPITIEQLDITESPAFEYREILWSEAFDRDWAARNRINGSFTRLDDVRGGKIRYSGGHNYHPLVPPSRYFDDHPEYYSTIAGRRYWEHAQLCESNPEMMKLMTGHVYEWIEREPEISIFSITANDWLGRCECGHCGAIIEREGSIAGLYLYMLNAIAERVEKVHPEKSIGMSAYKESEKPPKTIVPQKNIIVRMAPIEGCKTHLIEECPLNKEIVENVRNWGPIAKKVYIWDYYTNFRQYLLPLPDLRCIEGDLRFYINNNVKGILMQGCHSSRGAYLSELKAFLMAKLLWNPNQSREPIIDDFITGVYGRAAGPVREYIDLLERKVLDDWLHADIREEATVEYLSEDVLEQAEKHLKEAQRLAADDPELSFRIERLSMPLEFVRLSQPIPHYVKGNLYVPDPDAAEYANMRVLNNFMTKVDKHNIAELREAYVLDEQYLRMRANVSAHEIVTIENRHLRVEFIPGLGGRISRLIHKATGKNVLRMPEPTDFRYPETAGYEERLFRGSTINKGPGYVEPHDYVIEETDKGKKITLTARLSTRRTRHDVLLTREIVILDEKPSLEFHSTVRLLEPGAQPVCINTGPELDLGEAAGVRVCFRQSSDSIAWFSKEDITATDRQEERFRDHAEFALFRGKTIKSGVWCAFNPQTNVGVIGVFDPAEVDVCYVKVGPKPNRFEMRLWGNEKQLEAGESLHLRHMLIITEDVEKYLRQ